MLASWLKNPRVVGEFLAPLCGTGSRARSIRLKRKRNAPEPLRDDDNLNGLRNLSFVNKMKISQANKLYHLTAQIVRYAVKHNMIVCVENTQFSLFRATTFWVSVAKLLRYTIFHSCQYGSNRQKKTMLAHNHIAFNQLPSCALENPRSIVTRPGALDQQDILPPVKKQHIQSSWLAMSLSVSSKQPRLG